MRKEYSRRRRLERDEAAKAARTPENLRSPISCIMGHVDTGDVTCPCYIISRLYGNRKPLLRIAMYE